MELLLDGRDGRKYPEVSGNQEEEKKKRKTDFFLKLLNIQRERHGRLNCSCSIQQTSLCCSSGQITTQFESHCLPEKTKPFKRIQKNLLCTSFSQIFAPKKRDNLSTKKILKKQILHHQLKFDFRTGTQESVIWDYQSCRNVWKILKLGENPNHILLPPKYML